MDSNVVVAVVSASSAMFVAIAALVMNVVSMGRAFAQQDKRLESLERMVDKRFEMVDKRFEMLDKRFDPLEHTLESVHLDLTDVKERLTRLEGPKLVGR